MLICLRNYMYTELFLKSKFVVSAIKQYFFTNLSQTIMIKLRKKDRHQ